MYPYYNYNTHSRFWCVCIRSMHIIVLHHTHRQRANQAMPILCHRFKDSKPFLYSVSTHCVPLGTHLPFTGKLVPLPLMVLSGIGEGCNDCKRLHKPLFFCNSFVLYWPALLFVNGAVHHHFPVYVMITCFKFSELCVAVWIVVLSFFPDKSVLSL